MRMYDAVHLPICMQCKREILFSFDELFIGKCMCVRERVLTAAQFAHLERYGPIEQMVILSGLFGNVPSDEEMMDIMIRFSQFGDLNDREVLISLLGVRDVGR